MHDPQTSWLLKRGSKAEIEIWNSLEPTIKQTTGTTRHNQLRIIPQNLSCSLDLSNSSGALSSPSRTDVSQGWRKKSGWPFQGCSSCETMFLSSPSSKKDPWWHEASITSRPVPTPESRSTTSRRFWNGRCWNAIQGRDWSTPQGWFPRPSPPRDLLCILNGLGIYIGVGLGGWTRKEVRCREPFLSSVILSIYGCSHWLLCFARFQKESFSTRYLAPWLNSAYSIRILLEIIWSFSDPSVRQVRCFVKLMVLTQGWRGAGVRWMVATWVGRCAGDAGGCGTKGRQEGKQAEW